MKKEKISKVITYSKLNWPKFFSVLFFVLLSFSYARIFATITPYSPGATLDPACSPGEVNCTVNVFNLPLTTLTEGQFLQNNSPLFHTFGTNNTFFGQNSGNLTTTGTGRNVGIGTGTLTLLTTGDSNIAMGYNALNAGTTVSGAVAIGYKALSLYNDTNSGTYEHGSVAIGTNTLANATTGRNTAIGDYSLPNLTTGDNNTVVGRDTGELITTGSANVIIGDESGSHTNAITTESTNIMIGFRVGLQTASEDNQMSIGNLIFARGGFGINNVIGVGNIGIGMNPTTTSNNRLQVGGNMIVDGSGKVGIGTDVPTTSLDINSDTFRLRNSKTPASASDTCDQGTIAWDSDYIYVCVSTNTWKRSSITTWP